MKKIFILLCFVLFVSISSLNAFSVNFSNGSFKPVLYNVTLFTYSSDGQIVRHTFSVLEADIKITSNSFNPYNANVYVRINGNLTISLKLVEDLMNVYPSYVDKYYFHGIIAPQMFNYSYDIDGYYNMLNEINNITYYIEYKGETFQYNLDFSKYRDFLKDFNNSIQSMDSSNFPLVKWSFSSDNFSKVGIGLYHGDKKTWDNQSLIDYQKIDKERERAFSGWFDSDNITGNSFDFSKYPGLILSKDYYIFKVKNFEPFSEDESNEGYNVSKFTAGFKKIPYDRCNPITTASGWKLLGTDENLFVDNLSDYFELSKINTIWTWVNNQWHIWSPVESIQAIISSYGINTLNVIYPHHGFWVDFK